MTLRRTRRVRLVAAYAGAAALVGLAAGCRPAPGDAVHVAVAANFAVPFGVVARGFETATGHRVAVTTGSTGGLYAQIAAGAPFEVFLAGDAERPRRLEEEGLAVAGSRFTYARGQLVLWSPGIAITDGAGVLRDGAFERLAIANPATAPYGRAARQTLETLGVWETIHERLVLGSDVGQAYQFVATGNADLGLIARAQLDHEAEGSGWLVPETLHAPVEQQAVLLAAGADDPAAAALLAYLRGSEAQRVLADFGYGSD
ncbi:MAG TPA: molybdate ABC transporter substrate-binding protein [Thermoanaerobaculia bacterium]|nr:molybdate ABC transporter substrate-binding protein [Thermoanaerobaculia bacterium]